MLRTLNLNTDLLRVANLEYIHLSLLDNIFNQVRVPLWFIMHQGSIIRNNLKFLLDCDKAE